MTKHFHLDFFSSAEDGFLKKFKMLPDFLRRLDCDGERTTDFGSELFVEDDDVDFG